MPRICAFRSRLAVSLLAIVATSQSARADLVTSVQVTTKSLAGGLTEYDYTLSNLSSSTVTASSFFVAVDPAANLTMLSAPMGWDISYATGDQAVGFTSPDPSVDILPGTSGLFSFDSPLPPALVPYEVAGIDGNGNYVVNDGMTMGPTSVPEPGSSLLLAVGVLGAIALLHRSRGNRSIPGSL